MAKPSESGASVGLGCLFILVTFVFAGPLWAWCTLKVYEWHVQPLFGGPHVDVWKAWALCIFDVCNARGGIG